MIFSRSHDLFIVGRRESLTCWRSSMRMKTPSGVPWKDILKGHVLCKHLTMKSSGSLLSMMNGFLSSTLFSHTKRRTSRFVAKTDMRKQIVRSINELKHAGTTTNDSTQPSSGCRHLQRRHAPERQYWKAIPRNAGVYVDESHRPSRRIAIAGTRHRLDFRWFRRTSHRASSSPNIATRSALDPSHSALSRLASAGPQAADKLAGWRASSFCKGNPMDCFMVLEKPNALTFLWAKTRNGHFWAKN